MQPLGKKGKHNYHNLSPEEVYNALRTMKDSKDIEISYDNRYVIVTLATILENINIAVIVTPDGNLKKDLREKVTRIITLYPYKKK